MSKNSLFVLRAVGTTIFYVKARVIVANRYTYEILPSDARLSGVSVFNKIGLIVALKLFGNVVEPIELETAKNEIKAAFN